MVLESYVWLIWSSAFLVPWLAAFIGYPRYRRMMLWASLFTTPLGLTEPLFVPEYWSPPSLFDLALTTGFDIESLIFCFAIGGVSTVLYNLLTGHVPAPVGEKSRPLHQHHHQGFGGAVRDVSSPVFFPWNPIYPGIIAMAVGAGANILCRPDLKGKTWIGGVLFLLYYAVFLAGLEWTAPGYIDRVWNLEDLSGIRIFFMPIEELIFAVAFGAYWADSRGGSSCH